MQDLQLVSYWSWNTLAVASFEIIVIIRTYSCHVIVVDMKNEHAKCSKEGLSIMAVHSLAEWRYCVTQQGIWGTSEILYFQVFCIEHCHPSVFADVPCFLNVLWSWIILELSMVIFPDPLFLSASPYLPTHPPTLLYRRQEGFVFRIPEYVPSFGTKRSQRSSQSWTLG